MSLADYLAKNYLGDSKKKDKKKDKKKKNKSDAVSSESSLPQGFELAEEEDEPVAVASNKVIGSSKGWKRVSDKTEVKPQIGLIQPADYIANIKRDDETVRPDGETVYRDASGRVIDFKEELQRRERQKRELQDQKERDFKKANQGELQEIERQEARERLDAASKRSLHVTADDSELNAEQRSKIKEQDPALMFDKKVNAKFAEGSANVSKTGRKLYTGAFPENRFGIKPGYRWDGVDRSNGFEKLWFTKQAEVRERKILEYTMQEEY